MILSIQQPEFLPWAGFFNKIKTVDRAVILDTVQFKKRYFENRCRLKIAGKEGWLTVPVQSKGKYEQIIKDVLVENGSNWGGKIWNSLLHNYKKAPYWNELAHFLEETFVNTKWEKLRDLNVHIIEELCKYMGIKYDFVLASELSVEGTGAELMINLSKDQNADSYLTGRFGKKYLDEKDFNSAGIELLFQDYTQKEYEQFNGPYVGPISVLDLILNKGKEACDYI